MHGGVRDHFVGTSPEEGVEGWGWAGGWAICMRRICTEAHKQQTETRSEVFVAFPIPVHRPILMETGKDMRSRAVDKREAWSGKEQRR